MKHLFSPRAWICFWLASTVLAAAAPSDDPADEMAAFHVKEGFAINLFASEADGVIKPIQSRFDARGRLWVIGSAVYPQLEPGQVPNDKVVILEDTNADGRVDRSTVFADGLFIPTGIELVSDGCYVGNSTELLLLRDTDGDGRADRREVVLRGFGTGDNHQNLNSFQWGPGGELWFSQGLHSHSRVETPWGVEKLDAAGIWRFRPRQWRLDPFFGSELAPHNPWGFVFDDWGQMFVLAGNGHGIYHPLPTLIRDHRIVQLDQIWKDYRGRKLCGGDIVGNQHLPEAMQGTMVAGGFMNNAVYHLRITEDGAGFSVSDLPPLVTSSDTRFRPVDVKIGPDGAIYVTDWFNPIIGHYQASFRHPDRDKVHGRIWRITAKGRPLVKQPAIASMPVPELLEQLKSTDRWARLQARRRLAEEDTSIVGAALKRWTASLVPSDPGYEHHLVEALGVYQSHETPEPKLLERLLRATDYRARAAAAEAVWRWQDKLDEPLKMLDVALNDEHPRVRLAAVVAASWVRRPETIDYALQAADRPMDKSLDFALRQCVYVLKSEWLPAFQNQRLAAMKNPQRLEFLVNADATPDTISALRRLLSDGKLDPERREIFLGILAETGSPDDLAMLLDAKSMTADGRYAVDRHVRVLTKLKEAARARRTKPAGNLAEALRSLERTEALRILALQLAGIWNVTELWPEALSAAKGPGSDELHITGGTVLARLRGNAAVTNLLELAEPGRSSGERLGAAVGLAQLDVLAAARVAASLLSGEWTEDRTRELMNALLQRRAGANALAEALRGTAPSRDSARLAMRVMNNAGRTDPKLLAVLNAAAGLEGEVLKPTPEYVTALMTEIRAQGDATRGAVLFKRADLGCVACHSIAGQGGTIGPDLNAIGSGQPLDFIIGAVLEPNKEVKENYEAVEITTADGEMHTGYRLPAAGASEFALRDTTLNRVLRWRRDDVKEIKARGSVMPPGLVNHLTRAELRDLFRYLSELGRTRPKANQ